MTKVRFYHNPRCSKSRQALALMEERDVDLQLVRYLETPLTVAELKKLAATLNCAPRDFMRRSEAIYKELDLDREGVSDAELYKAIVAHPVLLERPIAIHGKRAAIGRPPENILDVLKSA